MLGQEVIDNYSIESVFNLKNVFEKKNKLGI